MFNYFTMSKGKTINPYRHPGPSAYAEVVLIRDLDENSLVKLA